MVGGKDKMKNNATVNDVPDFLKKNMVTTEEKELGGPERCENKKRSSITCDSKVSPIEKDALIQSVRGMSREHLDIILDNIPIELVYNRLGRELDRNKAFIKSMKGAMSMVTNES